MLLQHAADLLNLPALELFGSELQTLGQLLGRGARVREEKPAGARMRSNGIRQFRRGQQVRVVDHDKWALRGFTHTETGRFGRNRLKDGGDGCVDARAEDPTHVHSGVKIQRGAGRLRSGL